MTQLIHHCVWLRFDCDGDDADDYDDGGDADGNLL